MNRLTPAATDLRTADGPRPQQQPPSGGVEMEFVGAATGDRSRSDDHALTRPLPPSTALLEQFYARTGLPLPRLEFLHGEDLPSPYRELLAHSSDMTPTLEAFWQRPLGLTVLSRAREGESYLREVVLKAALEGWPVEYGAIRIHLNNFPPRARQLVLQEQRPLGKILEIEAVAHLSWPQAFFRVQSDEHMANVLNLSEPSDLYGRRNVLLDGSRRLLAEVIEILAPVEPRIASL